MRVPLLAQHLEPSRRFIEEMSSALEEEERSENKKKKVKWKRVSSQKWDRKCQVDVEPTATAMTESTPESISFGNKIFLFFFSPLGIACIFLLFNMSTIMGHGLGLRTPPAETAAVHPNSVKDTPKEIPLPKKQAPVLKTKVKRFVHAVLEAGITNATNASTTEKVSFKIPFLDRDRKDHDCTKPMRKLLHRDCRLAVRKEKMQPIIFKNQIRPTEIFWVDTDCFVWSRKCRQRKRIAAQMLAMAKDAEGL
jgi:hypothetical protein